MLLSAVFVLVVAQSISEVPEGLMNNPVYLIVCRTRRAKMQDDARNFTINTHGFYSQYLSRVRVFDKHLRVFQRQKDWVDRSEEQLAEILRI